MRLEKFSLVYLATPYSKYPAGLERAFVDASRIAARLLRCGIKIYSPICHTHPIAIHGEVDPLDHSIWLPFDKAMMQAATAILVAKMAGWEQSKGIAYELETFRKSKKPIFYLDVDSFEFSEAA